MKAPKTGTRTCRLILIIRQGDEETQYAVKPIASTLHVRAFQVRKEDDTVYHCTQELSGKRECDCGSGVFRDKACKHIKSLAALGLFLTTRELLDLQRGRKS